MDDVKVSVTTDCTEGRRDEVGGAVRDTVLSIEVRRIRGMARNRCEWRVVSVDWGKEVRNDALGGTHVSERS